ncbi:glycosyltransferase family 2 protein [Clostridium tyrobutyricum]|uniref:glycosyltransferase family 2 protein n=1 Tax=Clostridium tyrobutyricum TaxID=1519 RepID=UPI0002EC658A|nr:glycosyltransferase [Clostridium tyrobutyricum]
MLKISVVMPVYNAEKYLKESIESILNQTYKNFEFIIINDGSIDSSLNIINTYAKKDNRIIVISRENKGLVHSLNEGIKLAKGKYIARMDADDISMPDRLEKQVNYLDKYEDISILGTCTNLIYDESLDKNAQTNYSFLNIKFNAYDVEDIFLKECAILHPSIMMRKNFLIEIDGYFDFDAEDYNLFLRAIKNGYKIAKLDDRLINYRIYNYSKSKSNLPKISKSIMLSRLLYIKDKYEKFNKPFTYLIWGTGNGGNIAYNVISKVFPNAKLVGAVDKFKKGKYFNIEITNPESVLNIKPEYIFVTTTPGREEAQRFLNENNYKYKEQYIFLY